MKNDDVKYVIVQAGGKGTRMGHYTQNRPKCLVPVNDIPMIINSLNTYKDKEVIIITDHLSSVLEKYLREFYKRTNYKVVRTTEEGTAGGMKKAVSLIPDDEPFILTWADLFFEEEPEFSLDNDLLVGLSNTFKCRWSLNEYKQLVNEGINCKFRNCLHVNDRGCKLNKNFERYTFYKEMIESSKSHYCLIQGD